MLLTVRDSKRDTVPALEEPAPSFGNQMYLGEHLDLSEQHALRAERAGQNTVSQIREMTYRPTGARLTSSTTAQQPVANPHTKVPFRRGV